MKKNSVLSSKLFDMKQTAKAAKLNSYMKTQEGAIQSLKLEEGEYIVSVEVDKKGAVRIIVPSAEGVAK